MIHQEYDDLYDRYEARGFKKVAELKEDGTIVYKLEIDETERIDNPDSRTKEETKETESLPKKMKKVKRKG